MNAHIDGLLRAAVDRGDVPNVVAVAADRHGLIYEGSAGPRISAEDPPVGPDTTYRLASMTKMVTTVAALRLVEQATLDLDAPVERYRPEFGELMVLERVDGGIPKLRPPAAKATVRQLAAHTAGLGYWFWNADLLAWENPTGVPNVMAGDARSFTAPLMADPGRRSSTARQKLLRPRRYREGRARPTQHPERTGLTGLRRGDRFSSVPSRLGAPAQVAHGCAPRMAR